jgi:hypothetical protein
VTNKKPGGKWVSANDALKSDPTDETRLGVPSDFQATLDQMKQLYDGLQLHYGVERLGKRNKWKLK